MGMCRDSSPWTSLRVGMTIWLLLARRRLANLLPSPLAPDNPSVHKPAPTRSALFTRSFKKQFLAAVKGEGAWLWDATGKRYLDLAGSAAVNFIGHGVAEIGQAMAAQAARLEFVHSSQFITPEAEEFAQEVLDLAGESFRGGCVYFTCGGSEAIETALKLAR